MTSLRAGIRDLCENVKTQCRQRIKPIHAYCATRLVLEGGFPPEWVAPRQPLASRKVNNAISQLELSLEPQKVSSIGSWGESSTKTSM
jgi:hypothetical protein